MKIYISTANQYAHLMKPFAHLFNIFWSDRQEVNVLGYDTPTFELPNNFKFISLGKQEGGIKMWSTDLKRFFESIDDKFFIYTVEDHFLTWPVNFRLLNKLISLLDDNVGRIGLTNDMPGKSYDFVEQYKNCHIIERRQDQEYRLSLLWCIWNREYLLKYLESNMDPHDFEIIGSNKAMNDGYKILGTVGDYAIHHCQGIRKGNLKGELGFNFINDPRTLDPNIIENMKKNGLI